MSSPSEELAGNIVSRLLGEGLIGADDADSLAGKMAEGKLKGADWRLAVEKAILRKEES